MTLRGGQDWGGVSHQLSTQLSTVSHAMNWTGSIPSSMGWTVGDCPDKSSGYFANLTEWKEQMLSCSFFPELGWMAQTLPLQTFVELLLG